MYSLTWTTAPGGSIIQDPDSQHYKTDICVFGAKEDFESLKAYYEVIKSINLYKQKYYEVSSEL